jgi:hypothetical protein
MDIENERVATGWDREDTSGRQSVRQMRSKEVSRKDAKTRRGQEIVTVELCAVQYAPLAEEPCCNQTGLWSRC